MSEDATILVAAVGSATGSRAASAALACAGSGPDRAGLLIDLAESRPPRSSLIATAAARESEERLAAHLPEAGVASRGQFCHLSLPADQSGIEQIPAALPLARGAAAIVHLPPQLLQPALAEPRIRVSAAMIRADLAKDRSLVALVAADLIERNLRMVVLKQPLGWFKCRLALLGALGSGGLPTGIVQRLLSMESHRCYGVPHD